MSVLKELKDVQEIKPAEAYEIYWQYLTLYVDTLISYLDLYKKVMFNIATPEETIIWISVFCKNNCNVRNINSTIIKMGYDSYYAFVNEEFKKCREFIDMHINTNMSSLEELKNSLIRVNRTLEMKKD